MESYTITPDDKGGVSVRVISGSGVVGFYWFKTEAEAKAWVTKQRTKASDRTERHVRFLLPARLEGQCAD
jgi:hypothetical protein